MSSSSKKQAKAKRPALEEAYIETSIKAQANTIDADPGSEAQHGQNSTGKSSGGEGVNSLAEDLSTFEIKPDESDQVGTTAVVQDGAVTSSNYEEDKEYASTLQSMRKDSSVDEEEPEEVRTALLETFDLAGIADYIQKGIPDFRSPETGLYNNLDEYNLPYPEALFELDYFKREPRAFYKRAKTLFPGRFKPTPAHYFITLLHNKGLLLRCFTQNIDSLEAEAKLPSEKLVAAHGNCDTAHCIRCHAEVSQETVRKAVNEDRVCHCPACNGYVKPDIIFFGERLPKKFFKRATHDFPLADLLIVMGTSLVVKPFASLIDHVGKEVPRLLINRERAGESDPATMFRDREKGFSFDEGHRDALFLGDCDDGVRQLANLLGWKSELDELISTGSQQAD